MARDVGTSHWQLVAADRPDRRVLDRGVWSIAGLHQVSSALVVPLLAHHRPNQGHRAHLVRQLLKTCGEFYSWHGRRDCFGARGDPRVGVGVKGFELAWPASQPQEDDRLRRLARPLGLVGQQLPDGRQPGEAGELEKAAAVEYGSAAKLIGDLNDSRRIPLC